MNFDPIHILCEVLIEGTPVAVEMTWPTVRLQAPCEVLLNIEINEIKKLRADWDAYEEVVADLNSEDGTYGECEFASVEQLVKALMGGATPNHRAKLKVTGPDEDPIVVIEYKRNRDPVLSLILKSAPKFIGAKPDGWKHGDTI